MLGCCPVSTVRGVSVHWAQSSVGKVSESWSIRPPTEGSRSTRTTSLPRVGEVQGGRDPGDAAADDEDALQGKFPAHGADSQPRAPSAASPITPRRASAGRGSEVCFERSSASSPSPSASARSSVK